MKWIKASERLPENWEFVFCRTTAKTIRFIDAPIRFIASEAMNGTVWGVHPYLNLDNGFDISVVEWLDESEDCFDDVPEFVKHWDQEELKKAAKAKVDEIEDVDYEELIQLFIDGTEWAFVKSNK